MFPDPPLSHPARVLHLTDALADGKIVRIVDLDSLLLGGGSGGSLGRLYVEVNHELVDDSLFPAASLDQL